MYHPHIAAKLMGLRCCGHDLFVAVRYLEGYEFHYLWDGHFCCVWLISTSSSFSVMPSSALSTGTLLKRTVMSYDTSFHTGGNSIPLSLSTSFLCCDHSYPQKEGGCWQDILVHYNYTTSARCCRSEMGSS